MIMVEGNTAGGVVAGQSLKVILLVSFSTLKLRSPNCYYVLGGVTDGLFFHHFLTSESLWREREREKVVKIYN